MSAIIGQVLPFLSQEHQQQVATAVERAKQVTMQSMVLVRNSDLDYSALRVQFSLPIVWTTGSYYL